MTIPWGPTGLFVYNNRYSRTQSDGTKEALADTVVRVVDGNTNLVPLKHIRPGETTRLVDNMMRFADMPAGRHWWASGVKGRQFLMNCWVSHWTDRPSEHFEFSFLRLMEGGGVGSNYSNKYLTDYPTVVGPHEVHIVCDPDHPDYAKMRDAGLLSDRYVSDWGGAFEVEDSREGWAEALVDLIDTYYRDATYLERVFDVSRVRGEGERLKSFGGTASGPAPLAVMLHEVSGVLDGCGCRQLDGISAMEIDHAIGKCVVSGGTRRSARMSMMRWDDGQIREFLRCKGSAEASEEYRRRKQSYDDVLECMENGELLTAAQLEILRAGAPEPPETKHWTTNISVEIDDVFITGLDTGDSQATWVMDRIVDGMLSNGEPGVWNSDLSAVGEPDRPVCTNPCLTGDTVISTVDGPRTFADLADDGRDVEVHAWHPETKLPVVRWMRRPHKTAEGVPVLKVDFDSGLSVRCTPDHGFYSFRGERVDAQNLRVGQSVHAWSMSAAGFDGTCANHKVVSIEEYGHADVYNGMVEDAHSYIVLDPEPVAGISSGIVSANCGEIALLPWEPCNLGHVNLAAFVDVDGEVDMDGLKEAHRLMTRFLIRATYGDVTDEKSRDVLDRNRRIGVGQLGFASHVAMRGIRYSDAPYDPDVVDMLRILKETVEQEARDYAHQLRIPVPVKVTTVAPTGTIAKMPGVSEGVHPIFGKYFIRRVRLSTIDPDQITELEKYRQAGYHVEDAVNEPNTAIVAIPTKDTLVEQVESRYGAQVADQVVQSAAELSVRDMLRVQELYQSVWADNAVSYTVNVDPDRYTVDDLKHVLKDYLPLLKGMTVFPEMSHVQPPYERVNKAWYESRMAKDVSDGVDEECASGACPVF